MIDTNVILAALLSNRLFTPGSTDAASSLGNAVDIASSKPVR
jgi:hypothetical protein